MRPHLGMLVLAIVVALGAGAVAWRAWRAWRDDPGAVEAARVRTSIAVEVAPVESGTIRERRVLTGTLEPVARFTVSAKAAGLIEAVLVDIGDEIDRGAVVARIDDAEYRQAAAQAEAELAVRNAERARAESDRTLAERDLERMRTLADDGIVPTSQLDAAAAALEAGIAASALADARVQQAEAALALARIRLGYAEVRADWSGEPARATVAGRALDPGDTVQVGDPIAAIVKLDPLVAVVSITEQDYARLAVGQAAVLSTDALAGETFAATVARIAPVFAEASRQARVELAVPNPERRLRPGMFVRVEIVLRTAEAETIVPEAAIVRRAGRTVVFLADDAGRSVREVPVELGIVADGRVEIVAPALQGRVVVLGQQLLEDGAPIAVADDRAAPGAEPGS